MKFLADEHIPVMMVTALRDRGHDVLTVREHFAGLSDATLVSTALAADRIILTFDSDFGEFHHRQRMRPFPAVIYVRTRGESLNTASALLLSHLDSDDSWSGHFSVIDCATGKARKAPLLNLG